MKLRTSIMKGEPIRVNKIGTADKPLKPPKISESKESIQICLHCPRPSCKGNCKLLRTKIY